MGAHRLRPGPTQGRLRSTPRDPWVRWLGSEVSARHGAATQCDPMPSPKAVEGTRQYDTQLGPQFQHEARAFDR